MLTNFDKNEAKKNWRVYAISSERQYLTVYINSRRVRPKLLTTFVIQFLLGWSGHTSNIWSVLFCQKGP